jgi:hypothetical protein
MDGARQHKEGLHVVVPCGPKRTLEVVDRVDFEEPRCEAQFVGGHGRGLCGRRVGHRIAEEGDPGERGHRGGQELDVLGDDLFILGGEPGEVPAGMREARRETEPDRVGQEDGADNRDAAGGLLDSPECGGPGRDDHVHLEPDEVSGEHSIALGLAFGPAVLDTDVLPLDPPQVAKALPKRLDKRGRELRV